MAARKAALTIAAGVIGNGDARYVEVVGSLDIARNSSRPRRTAAQAERIRELEEAPRTGTVFEVERDGFIGEVRGSYVTREDKRGVVLQQIGTRVVHVYGWKWLKLSACAALGGNADA